MSELIVVANGIVDPGYDASLRHHAIPNEEQIAACQAWLQAFASHTKTIRQRHSSYGYKHRVENWTRRETGYDQIDFQGRRWHGDCLYISNGAFIVAAQREGYIVKRCDYASLNAWFNLSTSSRRSRAQPVMS